MNRHLIIGASGQVGEHILSTLTHMGVDAVGTRFHHGGTQLAPLDICNSAAVTTLIDSINPDVIYLPASLTNVDYCESHPREGYDSNVLGVCNVVRAANKHSARLIYFSSDYIWDGFHGPYREEDPANPICEYGRQKLLAEHFVSLHAPDSLIIRTTVVFGWESQGKNFVCRLIKTLHDNRPLTVPNDQIGNPTYAPDLANAVISLVSSGVRGVYNVAGSQRTSRYMFALAAAEIFGLDPSLIRAIPTCELNQTASRPLNAGMVVLKAQQALNRSLVGFEDGLRMMAQEKVQ